MTFLKCKERAHAGNTTYTVIYPPNSTKSRHRNNMNLDQYKTHKNHRNMKQTFIKGKMGVPPWNGQRQNPLRGLNQVYERSIQPLSHHSPTRRKL